MIYRDLGNTGLKVSQLGFGAMRLPMVGEGEAARVNRDLALPMIHRAFAAGVNYIDTAVGYCNSDSQVVVGEALVGWRDRIIVSTKNPSLGENESEWRRNLENSLARLKVQCIDIYNQHGLNWKNYVAAYEPRILGWVRKAQQEGLVRHICCSFHDTNEALIRLIDTGHFRSITLQYNLLDRQLEEGIAHAHAKGVGVVVMGPVGGGRLGVETPVLKALAANIARIPELALRFVLANPRVSMALSGMSTLQQVEENLATASDPASLSDEDKRQITEHLQRLRKMADLYCTGCNYCKPCPNGVDIPAVFGQYNLARVYGLWDSAKRTYARLRQRGKSAEKCVQCGECEPKCPQHLPIRDQLDEVGRKLG